MAQMNLIVTPAFEAALESLMRRRGFATKSEAVRVVVEEAARVETLEEIRTERLKALREMRGSWVSHNDDLPRRGDGNIDWSVVKDELHQGMP